MNRSALTTKENVELLWEMLGLPHVDLEDLCLEGGDDVAISSSFKIGHLAQSSIGLSGLLASTIHAVRSRTRRHKITVERQHAVIEFCSEKLYTLNGKPPARDEHLVGGLHRTSDGHVRVHDSFPNHRDAALRLLNCPSEGLPNAFVDAVLLQKALDLEAKAAQHGAVIYSMRTYNSWDATDQARALPQSPISIRKVADSKPSIAPWGTDGGQKCLSGIRVLEMSRVIAGPVAGKTLAAHGADVLWITSPSLPSLPSLDMDLSRGKRTVQFEINRPEDRAKLVALLQKADVFLQSYRPGSLANKGLSIEHLLGDRNGRPLICANLSAWGTEGPWSGRRGFDSIVQTASGMNVSEAEHYGQGEARPLPCQALDHGAGYFLASGVMAALYRQATEGGSYCVDVSLAGVGKHLRSLGQYDGNSGFGGREYRNLSDVPVDYTERRNCAFGELQSIKHAVQIEGLDVGWGEMPKPLGSDEAVWLPR